MIHTGLVIEPSVILFGGLLTRRSESGRIDPIFVLFLRMVAVIVMNDILDWLEIPNWVEYTTLFGGLAFFGVRSARNKWHSEHWYKLRLAVHNPKRPAGQPYDFSNDRLSIKGSGTIRVVEPRGKVSLRRFDVRLVTFGEGIRKQPIDAPLDLVKL